MSLASNWVKMRIFDNYLDQMRSYLQAQPIDKNKLLKSGVKLI